MSNIKLPRWNLNNDINEFNKNEAISNFHKDVNTKTTSIITTNSNNNLGSYTKLEFNKPLEWNFNKISEDNTIHTNNNLF